MKTFLQFSRFVGVLLVGASFAPSNAAADVTISKIVLDGNNRTNQEWLETYLGISPPTTAPDSVVELVRRKLMTTDVFVHVDVELTNDDQGTPTVLKINLIEKWTTIPVIRAAFGGGTPMTVFGIYDTHSFGKLWTLGAEARKYGDAPSSYVVWARAPRWLRGRHFLNLELWRLNRIRSMYDRGDEKIGDIRSDAKIMRLTFLQPLIDPEGLASAEYTVQFGLDFRIQNQAGTSFTPDKKHLTAGPPETIKLKKRSSIEKSLMPTVLYDSIEIDGSRYSGIRAILQNGLVWDDESPHRKYETEVFVFQPLPFDTLMALHMVAGATSLSSIHNQYFLGGFDSIRGIPDGAVVGSKAIYGNIEFRRSVYRLKFAHFEGAAFTDIGGAAEDWDLINQAKRNTAGLGLRINIPQVYRLQFRIDYAFAVDGTSARGVNIGLNQFFQPYKPL